MPLDLQYDILNDTPASASPVEANFNRIEQHTNQELISRDGTTAMAAQLKLVGDPVSPLDAAPKQYVDQVLPVGIIMMFGGAAVPPGGRWALCNGAELESATSPELFAVIAQNFSPPGTPAGRYHLPNLTDRFPMGRGTTAALGAVGGSADAVIPKHSHAIDHAHAAGDTGTVSADHTHTVGAHAHTVDIWSSYTDVNHYHAGLDGQNTLIHAYSTGIGYAAGGSQFGAGTTHWSAQDINHRHAVNGVSGSASPQTGGISTNHYHAFTTPAFSGRSGEEGVAVTNTNLPPYVGVSYIIRVS